MTALHGCEDPVRSALYRKVDVVDQFRDFGIGLNECVGELDRVGSGVADPVDPLDAGHGADQFREIAVAAVGQGAPIGVDILPQEVDLADALPGEFGDLGEDVERRSAHLFAPGVWHHAKGAVLGTALHHGYLGADAVGHRARQVIELFNFREADVHYGTAGGRAALADQFRQAVQGLGPED